MQPVAHPVQTDQREKVLMMMAKPAMTKKMVISPVDAVRTSVLIPSKSVEAIKGVHTKNGIYSNLSTVELMQQMQQVQILDLLGLLLVCCTQKEDPHS